MPHQFLSAQDILDSLNIHDDSQTSVQTNRQIRFDSPDAQRIYDLIVAGHNDGDELSQLSQLSASELSIALTMLELNGYIKALGNNKFVSLL